MHSRHSGAFLLILATTLAAAPKKDLPQRVAARQDLVPKGIEGAGLKGQQINDAIDRGAKFLWEHLKTTDLKARPQLGARQEHVLCALALVHAGAHKKYEDFDKTLRQFLAGAEAGQGSYQDALLAMLIESYGDSTYEPQMRRLARYLLESQGEDGTWTYRVGLRDAPSPARQLRALAVSGGIPLDADKPVVEPMKRARPWEKLGNGDNSCTQYAMLGLNSATRAGLAFPAETWQRDLVAFVKNQSKEGGWGYSGAGRSYGSMTCAGICSVAIARHQLGEKEPAVDEGIEKGLGWLAANFSVTEHPGWDANWHYYYLYGLERVGRILDTEFIGPHEWYPLGAKVLVERQKADGSWKGAGQESDERLATSFALLFLTRATPSLDMQPKRGGAGTLRTEALARPSRIYFILDASGSMLEERDGKQKFDLARDAVLGILKQVPDDAEVALRVYGHRKRAIEDGAGEDTELLFPLARLDRPKMEARLRMLRARGKTPLALSLREAARDLSRSVSENRPATVVLLTDGGEDTFPRQDPLKSADELRKLKGLDLQVVGFDLAERQDWTQQLQDICKRGGGRYWPATKADSLQQQLRCAVLKTPEQFAVTDKSGKQVAAGAFGESKKLPEGKYTLRSAYADREFQAAFWINTDRTTSIVFDAEAAAADPGAAPATQPAPPPATHPSTPPTSQPAPARFCGHCGKPVAPGAKFCTECGQKIGE